MADRIMPEIQEHTKDRFWSKVDVCGPDDCWPWKASIQTMGYGSFGIKGKIWGAHIVALIFSGSDKPEAPRNKVLHSCDKPSCCNPAHLRWGTQKENMQDRVSRGRYAKQIGSMMAWKRKFTPDQVREIRASPLPTKHFVEMYGVNRSTINMMRRRVTFRDVE